MISNAILSKEQKQLITRAIPACNASNILTVTKKNQPRKARSIRELSGTNSTITMKIV